MPPPANSQKLLFLLAGLSFTHQALASPPVTTQWQQSAKSISRLVAGNLPVSSGPPRLIVGLEIHIERDWKTYWRHPGDAGGIPPRLDWSKSQNLKSATVMYPAPERISDPAGTLIGYKEHVLFPIEVEPVDPERPIRLALDVEYGVCREVCILAQARHSLTIRTTKAIALAPPLFQALERVPRPEQAMRATDPRLIGLTATLTGPAPRIEFLAAFPGGTRKKVDLFVEMTSGSHLPMARRPKSENSDKARFEITIPSDTAPKSLVGKTLRITLVSASGASEFLRTLD